MLDMSLVNSVLIATKQVINSLINDLLAMLLLLAITQLKVGEWSRTRQASYQELLMALLTAFALIPSSTILSYLDRQINNELDQEVVSHLDNVKQQISPLIKHWLDENFLILGSVAADSMSLAERQLRLDLLQATDRDFSSIAILDRDLRVVARAPRNDDLGVLVVGQDFSSQPHLVSLKTTRQPTVTGLITQNVGRQEPAALMLLPTLKDGQFNGCVSGVIKPKALEELLQIVTRRWQGQFYLLDQQERVIVSDHEHIPTMTPAPAIPVGTFTPKADGIQLWTPARATFQPLYEQQQRQKYIASFPLPIPGAWSLRIEAPVAPLRARMAQNYLNSSLLALAMVLPSVLIANWLSRRLLRTTDWLGEISADLPRKIACNDTIIWPESRIFEVTRLVDNFRQMEQSLRQKFGELSVSYQNLQLESTKRQFLEDRHAHLRITHEQEERVRISRELHDGIGQTLAATKMKLEEAVSQLALAPQESERINEIIADLGRTNAELRDIVYALRPSFFETMSLCDALRWYSKRLATAKQEIHVDVEGGSCKMPEEVKYQLYRIIQEAVFNAVKHSSASLIQITLRSVAGHICIEVWDDGIGGVVWPQEATAAAGHGLQIMSERVELLGGKLGIHSLPDEGTTLLIEVPTIWPVNES